MENNLQNQNEQEQKIKELHDILLEKSEGGGAYMNKIVKMSNSLKAEHQGENLYDYRLYHLMIGSTPDESCVKFDLPDGAIEKAIRGMNNELKERIIDPNLDRDLSHYGVVLTGQFGTKEKLKEAFLHESPNLGIATLSIVLDRENHLILIGDTHEKMKPSSRLDLSTIFYAQYNKASGKIEVHDFTYLSKRTTKKVDQSVKDVIAAKLQEAIYGN